MNGRELFEKFNGVIEFLVKVTKKLPRQVRLWILNVNRNKSGKLAMLKRYVAVASLAEHTAVVPIIPVMSMRLM